MSEELKRNPFLGVSALSKVILEVDTGFDPSPGKSCLAVHQEECALRADDKALAYEITTAHLALIAQTPCLPVRTGAPLAKPSLVRTEYPGRQLEKCKEAGRGWM